MILDEQDLRNGTDFIVGMWQPDYVVNMFSKDLAHIPAGEFKSTDGVVFTAISFTFFDDHTLQMKNSVTGKTVMGTWEQKSYGEFRYTLNGFLNLPVGTNADVAETLRMQDGKNLVFSLGVIAIALKKISEDKKQDIAKLRGDDSLRAIVGTYAVGKIRTYTDEGFVWTADAAKAADDTKQMFDWRVEFTADHKVLVWMDIPEGTTDAYLKEAIRQGEVAGVKDGRFTEAAKEWKAVDGKYYYNTAESDWKELKSDEEGNLYFSNDTVLLKKIN